MDSGTCVQILRGADHLDTTGLSCCVDFGEDTRWFEFGGTGAATSGSTAPAQTDARRFHRPTQGGRCKRTYCFADMR